MREAPSRPLRALHVSCWIFAHFTSAKEREEQWSVLPFDHRWPKGRSLTAKGSRTNRAKETALFRLTSNLGNSFPALRECAKAEETSSRDIVIMNQPPSKASILFFFATSAAAPLPSSPPPIASSSSSPSSSSCVHIRQHHTSVD